MAEEMLCGDIDQFLCHYAPFCLTEDSIDSVLKKLNHKRILHNDKWWDFCGTWAKKKETEAFRKLEAIVKTLMGQECFGTDSKAPCKCNFNYYNCGNTQMVGEIPGRTFQIDGYFLPEYSPPLFESTKVMISQVSVSQLLSQNKANCSLSVFDKENSIKFPLDLLHYIYNYYVAMLLYFSWSPCYLLTDSPVIYCDL